MNEDDEKSIDKVLKESAWVGVIGYTCLLLGTLLGTGIFGLPKYILTPYNDNHIFSSMGKMRFFSFRDIPRNIGVFIFKLIFFFIDAIFSGIIQLPLSYIKFFLYGCEVKKASVLTKLGYKQTVKLNNIEALKNIAVIDEANYESAISLLSMCVAVTWIIFLWREVEKMKIVEEVINDDNLKE